MRFEGREPENIGEEDSALLGSNMSASPGKGTAPVPVCWPHSERGYKCPWCHELPQFIGVHYDECIECGGTRWLKKLLPMDLKRIHELIDVPSRKAKTPAAGGTAPAQEVSA